MQILYSRVQRKSVGPVLFFFVWCSLMMDATRANCAPPAKRIGTHTPAEAKSIISQRARAVVMALKTQDMVRLSRYVHPTQGVRFSPYVSTAKEDHTFTAQQVRRLKHSGKRYLWGAYDGSGQPIRLTWRDYYKRFVYNGGFASAREVHFNTAFPRGNTINGLQSVYPRAIFVEYHIPDPIPQSGHHWKSLWLIWQQWHSTWYLVGIANDQWTI